ncbi:MAG: hypothetical protein KJS97_08795 [Alphaproteobacteria bacterium]|nr:hypothetical protein [Alphaproteobacteria bacterium]
MGGVAAALISRFLINLLGVGALWSVAALVRGAAAAIFGASTGRRARLPDGRIPIGAERAPTNMKAAQRPQH